MSVLSSRIRQRREELGMSQEELASRMGINDIPQNKLEDFADALETSTAWLLGLDSGGEVPRGFEPMPRMARVPLVGSIACGTPITAEQNIERYTTGTPTLP